jgi:hypothetical protein
VTRERIAQGSKSDRVGVVLRTDSGEEYVLRRKGGNAFRDPALDQLVGKSITGSGLVAGRTFIMESWTVEKDD